MVWAAVDEAAGGFGVPGRRFSPVARCLEPARTWLPVTVCLVGNSSPPSEAPRRTRPVRRCPGAARAAQPLLVLCAASVMLRARPLGPAELGEPVYRGLSRNAELGGAATLQRGVLPGLCRVCPQSHGVFRHDQCHALQGFGDLVLGAGDGDGQGGEALS